VSAPISAEKINFTFASLVMGILIAQMGMKFPQEFIDGESGTNFLNLSRTMILTFANFITISSVALSIGVEIIISRDIGSSNYVKARKEIKKCFIIAIIFDISLAIGLVFLRSPIIDFFSIGPNQIVIDNRNLLNDLMFVPLILTIFLQFGRTSNIIFLSGVRPSGNLKANMISSIILTWFSVLIGFIVGYLLLSKNPDNFTFGVNGIFFAMALDEVFRGISNFAIWQKGNWMKKSLF
ncbi:MAG: hypothetical protein KFW07_02370, partial [Mycoplasmataceae bacterium]|nr:hypothetical protein [Mycoplasmataceae bacterium]